MQMPYLLRCCRCGLLQLEAKPHPCAQTSAVSQRVWSLFRKTTEIDRILSRRHHDSLALAYWVTSFWNERCSLQKPYTFVPCLGNYHEFNALVADLLACQRQQSFSYAIQEGDQVWVDMEVRRECLIQLNKNSNCILWAFTAWLSDDDS